MVTARAPGADNILYTVSVDSHHVVHVFVAGMPNQIVIGSSSNWGHHCPVSRLKLHQDSEILPMCCFLKSCDQNMELMINNFNREVVKTKIQVNLGLCLSRRKNGAWVQNLMPHWILKGGSMSKSGLGLNWKKSTRNFVLKVLLKSLCACLLSSGMQVRTWNDFSCLW